MPVVELLDHTGRYPHKRELGAALRQLMLEHGLRQREVTVVLMNDDAIAAHNLADRQVAGPTDVLSYPTSEPDDVGFPDLPHLGDILISLDTAERQAQEQGHALTDEVLTLTAHGLTHLRGFDHQTDEEWLPFTTAQRRILDIARSLRATGETSEITGPGNHREGPNGG